MNRYEIIYKYFSKDGEREMFEFLCAEDFGEVEKKFWERFEFCGNVIDRIYGDDVVAEIVCIKIAKKPIGMD